VVVPIVLGSVWISFRPRPHLTGQTGAKRCPGAGGPSRSDGPKVDILNGDKKVFEELAYKDVTPYAPVPAGEVTFAVVETTKTTPRLLEVKVKLEAGKRYTIAAMGTAKQLQGQVLNDDFNIDPNQATVRVVHASADTPAVDVAVKGGTVLFKGLSFGKASAFTGVKEGTYDLEVRPAGKTEVALPLSGLAFASGKVYTVFAVGSSADKTLDAVVVEDTYSLQ